MRSTVLWAPVVGGLGFSCLATFPIHLLALSLCDCLAVGRVDMSKVNSVRVHDETEGSEAKIGKTDHKRQRDKAGSNH